MKINFAALESLVGQEILVSQWKTITQEQVMKFADATGDHQWIHVDVERAKTGPFGGPIAHGFMTLSLLPSFLTEEFQVDGSSLTLNYGLNKVRFVTPVPVPSRVRVRLKLAGCDAVEKGGKQLTLGATFECEGIDKPACVAESVIRVYP